MDFHKILADKPPETQIMSKTRSYLNARGLIIGAGVSSLLSADDLTSSVEVLGSPTQNSNLAGRDQSVWDLQLFENRTYTGSGCEEEKMLRNAVSTGRCVSGLKPPFEYVYQFLALMKFCKPLTMLAYLAFSQVCVSAPQIVEELGNPHAGRWSGDSRIAANAWDMQLVGKKVFLASGERERNAGPIKVYYWDTENNVFVSEATVSDEQIVNFNLMNNGDLLVPAEDPRGSNNGPGYLRNATTGLWTNVPGMQDQHFYALHRYKGFFFADEGGNVKRSGNGGASWQTLIGGITNIPTTPHLFELNGSLYLGGMFFQDSQKLHRYDETIGNFVSTGKGRGELFGDGGSGYTLFPTPFNNGLAYLRRGDKGNSHNNFTNERKFYFLNSTLDLTVIQTPNLGFARDLIFRDGALRILTNIPEKAGLIRGPYWNSKQDAAATNGSYTLWEPQNSAFYAGTNQFHFFSVAKQGGLHSLSLKWPVLAGLRNQVKVEVRTAAGTFPKTINQTTGGGTWVQLGNFQLAANENFEVIIKGDYSSLKKIAIDALQSVCLSDGHHTIVDDADRVYLTEVYKTENLVDWIKDCSFRLDNMTRTFEYVDGSYYVSRGNSASYGSASTILRDFDRVDSKIGTLYKVTPAIVVPFHETRLDPTGGVLFGDDGLAYGTGQDGSGGRPTALSISTDRLSATITGNAWKRFPLNYNVTANTVLQVTVTAANAGEILGLALDNDNNATTGRRAFLFGGSDYANTSHDDWSWKLTPVVTAGGAAQTYQVPVGTHFTGSVSNLGLIGDHDASGTTNATFSNLRLYESVGYDALRAVFNWGNTPEADRTATADANGNGVSNLLELAFNLSPTAPGGPITLTPGTGTSGLPVHSVATPFTTPTLQLEYLRRKNSGLIYTVMFSGNLVNWTAATGTPATTSIDTNWERCVMPDPAGSNQTKRFVKVEVSEVP
jgi:hypothetical protein